MTEYRVGQMLPELRLSVTATGIVAAAMASRDYSPLHHDRHYVDEVGGHPDIFANTPHQAALFERYLFDWAGGEARIARMRFSMHKPLYAGSEIVIGGEVADVDEIAGSTFIGLLLTLRCAEDLLTDCQARIALPDPLGNSPWALAEEAWQP